jgi:hypothetical protein
MDAAARASSIEQRTVGEGAPTMTPATAGCARRASECPQPSGRRPRRARDPQSPRPAPARAGRGRPCSRRGRRRVKTIKAGAPRRGGEGFSDGGRRRPCRGARPHLRGRRGADGEAACRAGPRARSPRSSRAPPRRAPRGSPVPQRRPRPLRQPAPASTRRPSRGASRAGQVRGSPVERGVEVDDVHPANPGLRPCPKHVERVALERFDGGAIAAGHPGHAPAVQVDRGKEFERHYTCAGWGAP